MQLFSLVKHNTCQWSHSSSNYNTNYSFQQPAQARMLLHSALITKRTKMFKWIFAAVNNEERIFNLVSVMWIEKRKRLAATEIKMLLWWCCFCARTFVKRCLLEHVISMYQCITMLHCLDVTLHYNIANRTQTLANSLTI